MYQPYAPHRRSRILIRMVLPYTLCDEGDVVEAGKALKAVTIVGQRRIDAMATDFDMPDGLKGLDLTKMISSTRDSETVRIGRFRSQNSEITGRDDMRMTA